MRYFLFILFLYLPAHADWLVKQIVDANNTVVKIESVEPVIESSEEDVRIKRHIREFISETEKTPERYYQELLVSDEYFNRHYSELELYQYRLSTPRWDGAEVRTLVNQGDVRNRVDLTFVGDGYTADQKEQFFDDVNRMVKDMFEGQTFASYLSLFNVHAVFVPSRQSGITDIVRKDTALGLYRSPKGSKRGIMPGNTRAIEKAIALAPDTDYPILIANDDYYGGLGGRYAISTRSVETGTIVLRHELGHNFGEVGEEYDGGQVYSGANHSRTQNVHWKNWIKTSQIEVFESQFLSGNYVWKNLKDGPFKATFNFPGEGYNYDIDISSVGWATPNDVEVFLNGERKELAGVWSEDRSFFKFAVPETLEKGTHTIEIREKIQDGDNVLAFANIYAHPVSLNDEKHFVGAFNTFFGPGRPSGYRPTYDSCLMRNMRSVDFCAVDKENMWRKFFRFVSLIEAHSVDGDSLKIITPNVDHLVVEVYKLQGEEKILVGSSTGTDSFKLNGAGDYQIYASFEHPEVMGGQGAVTQTVNFKAQ